MAINLLCFAHAWHEEKTTPAESAAATKQQQHDDDDVLVVVRCYMMVFNDGDMIMIMIYIGAVSGGIWLRLHVRMVCGKWP